MSEKLMKLPQVIEATTRGKTAIYTGVKSGTFPPPISLGLRAVAWRKSDIDYWIGQRAAAGWTKSKVGQA